ncbi:MAG: sigma-70 family RNA polymerase sigma factor [Planctomycetes bacterium]|nr:sigma-70 family RNA polymerase sigma factor [Planctomycetota bacterium]
MADPTGGNPRPATDRSAWRAQVGPAAGGDRAARAALYETFAPVVHGIVLALVGRQVAEDVTHDVFCSVFASLPRLRDADAFPGFVATAARNAARDVLRRRQRAPLAAPFDARQGDPVDPAAAPDERAAGRELAARVLAAIAALPEAYRETLTLRLVAGLSGAEIAERTGMTHGSVRVNLTRGMAQLRAALGDAVEERR